MMLRREEAIRQSGRTRASREIGKRAMPPTAVLRSGLRMRRTATMVRERLILRRTRIAPQKMQGAQRHNRWIAVASVPSLRRRIARQRAAKQGHHRLAAAAAVEHIGTALLPVLWGSAVMAPMGAMAEDRVRNSICGNRSCEVQHTADTRAAKLAVTEDIVEHRATVDPVACPTTADRIVHRPTVAEAMPRPVVPVTQWAEVVVTPAAVAEVAIAAVVDTGKPPEVCQPRLFRK